MMAAIFYIKGLFYAPLCIPRCGLMCAYSQIGSKDIGDFIGMRFKEKNIIWTNIGDGDEDCGGTSGAPSLCFRKPSVVQRPGIPRLWKTARMKLDLSFADLRICTVDNAGSPPQLERW